MNCANSLFMYDFRCTSDAVHGVQPIIHSTDYKEIGTKFWLVDILGQPRFSGEQF